MRTKVLPVLSVVVVIVGWSDVTAERFVRECDLAVTLFYRGR
jgi:hypothetical protein